mgnify:CR=1 FL=1
MVPVPIAEPIKFCAPPKQTFAFEGWDVIAVTGVTVMVIPAAFAAAIPPVKQLLGKLDVIVKDTTALFAKVVVVYVAAVPTVVPFTFQSYVGVAPMFKALATLNVTNEFAQIVVPVF